MFNNNIPFVRNTLSGTLNEIDFLSPCYIHKGKARAYRENAILYIVHKGKTIPSDCVRKQEKGYNISGTHNNF